MQCFEFVQWPQEVVSSSYTTTASYCLLRSLTHISTSGLKKLSLPPPPPLLHTVSSSPSHTYQPVASRSCLFLLHHHCFILSPQVPHTHINQWPQEVVSSSYTTTASYCLLKSLTHISTSDLKKLSLPPTPPLLHTVSSSPSHTYQPVVSRSCLFLLHHHCFILSPQVPHTHINQWPQEVVSSSSTTTASYCLLRSLTHISSRGRTQSKNASSNLSSEKRLTERRAWRMMSIRSVTLRLKIVDSASA